MPACPVSPQFAKRGDFYRCIPFEQFDWLTHGFPTRNAQPPASITTLKQIHSAEVRNAAGLCDRASEGDALISNGRQTPIGIRTADCVPILLADPEMRAVAAIHAGWRGTAAGISGRTVDRLHAEFKTMPDNIHAAIGPAIRVCCYEVGQDVAGQFQALFPEWKQQKFQADRRMLDLIEANRRVLMAAGVLERQIYDSVLCTFCCAAEFYSFRREPNDPGRMLSFIARND